MKRRLATLCSFSVVCALVAACRPDLGDRESLITQTRVLAVRGEPPEAKAGETVSYTLLVASPQGLSLIHI